MDLSHDCLSMLRKVIFLVRSEYTRNIIQKRVLKLESQERVLKRELSKGNLKRVPRKSTQGRVLEREYSKRSSKKEYLWAKGSS